MRHSYFDTGFLDNHFQFIESSDIGRTLKILKLLNVGFGVLKDVQNAELVRELADAIPLQLQEFQNLKGFPQFQGSGLSRSDADAGVQGHHPRGNETGVGRKPSAFGHANIQIA